MDCAEPSIYNKKVEWYRGRGLWLDFPQVFMSEGVWKVIVPDGLGKLSGSSLEFESLSQVFDVQGRLNSDTAQQYRQIIYDAIEEAIQQKNMKFGALVMEPIILGAGGMFLCDPLFQRCFVDVVRSNPKLFSDTASTEQAPNKWSGLPVIFDEVFTGLYRLGRKSAGSFLKVDPDVVVNAKLLTGGLVPLCTTAASNEIFEVFSTPDKTDALLHGHSYTAHPLGCQVAVDSMKTMSIMEERGDWDAQRRDWGQQPFALSQDAKKPHEQKSTDVWSVWSKDFVSDLSYGKHVDGVFSIGTVLAIHLKDSEGKGM
ncbi:hypothetical protein KEM55_009108 [Ascosphaera atra]|nr:hypothetical protein KEM55_009108 [Ascosphaera atra]